MQVVISAPSALTSPVSIAGDLAFQPDSVANSILTLRNTAGITIGGLRISASGLGVVLDMNGCPANTEWYINTNYGGITFLTANAGSFLGAVNFRLAPTPGGNMLTSAVVHTPGYGATSAQLAVVSSNMNASLNLVSKGTGSVLVNGNAILVNPMTTAGDLITGGTGGAAGRLAIGPNGQVLTVVSGFPAWAAGGALVETTFGVAGVQALATGQGRYYVTKACTILGAVASLGTPPTGTSFIVDVLKNGVTIYTTAGNRPTIPINGNVSATVLVAPDITALAVGDYLTVNVAQIGSGTAGSDLTVTVRMTSP